MINETTWLNFIAVAPLKDVPIMLAHLPTLPPNLQGILSVMGTARKQITELDPIWMIFDPEGFISLAERVGSDAGIQGKTKFQPIGPRDLGVTVPEGWTERVRETGYAVICGYQDPFLAWDVHDREGAPSEQWARLLSTQPLGIARCADVTYLAT